MKRHFEAGAWSHEGKAMRLVDLHRVTLVGCSGGCNQGREACDCEYQASTFPDAARVIQPPIPAPEPNHRAIAARWALAAVAAGYLLLVLLLKLAGAQSFNNN
jgi:hypothetical protein